MLPGSAAVSIVLAAIGIILLSAFLIWQNNGLRLTQTVIRKESLPEDFSGFRILQISDYHNASALHDRIVDMVRTTPADMIAITGDLVDSRHTDIPAGLRLAEAVSSFAPAFYIPGNHEARIPEYDYIKSQLESYGITVLENTSLDITRRLSSIRLIGLKDPRFYGLVGGERRAGKRTKMGYIYVERLNELSSAASGFKLLLAHRPEFLPEYSDAGIDVALTGHSHGGQFSIPFTDIGVYVPNQGLFPRYAAGVKVLGPTTEVISRGLGNSSFPFRLFNRPEIRLITLTR